MFYLGFLVFTAAITIYSVMKADYSWDSLAYAGCVLQFENSDTDKIHRSVYDLLKTSADDKTYLQHTSGNSYRETLSECAECYNNTLPFYRIKILYIALIYIIHKLGVSLFFSITLISGAFYFLACITIYIWLGKSVTNEIHRLIASLLLSVSPFLINASSNTTPDMLSGFLILLSLYYMIVNRNLYLFMFFMLLSITARPDNIFLYVIITGILISQNDFSKQKKLLYAGAAVGVFIVILINIWSGSYGYSTLFYHSFVERLTNPAEFNIAITPQIYFKGLVNWAFMFKYSLVGLQFLILLIALYIRLKTSENIKNDVESLILAGLGLSIILHYIIFPLIDDRFFIAQYVVIDILFVKSVYSLVKSRTLS
jgi:hypothetical protein